MKLKVKSLLTYKKLTKLNTIGYSSKFTEIFIKEEFFTSVLKDFHSLLKNLIKNGDQHDSFDPDQPVPVLSLGGGGKGDSLTKIRELFKGKKSLELFLEELNTQKFCDYVFSNLNLKPHKLIQPNEKYRLRDFLLRERPCYLNCKLSAYPANSGIAFHRDNPRKLVAMLFYLGFSDHKIRKQAGTQFYSDYSSGQSFSKSSKDHIALANELTLAHDQHPIPNSFVAFETNNFSWHRVKKVDLERGIYRYNFQINFQIPTKFSLPMRIVYWIIRFLQIRHPERVLYY